MWLEYWKKSLKDSLIMDIDLDKSEYFEVDNYNIEDNNIEKLEEVNKLIDFEEKRLNNKKGITIKESEDWESIDSVAIVISIFKLVPQKNTSAFTNNPKSLFPFWFNAIIDRKGIFSIPDGNTIPIVPRKYLDPLVDDRYEYIFSSVEKVDKSVGIGFEEFKNYKEYIDYINKVFVDITDFSIGDYLSEDYNTIYNSIFLLPEEEVNAAYSIIQLYEKLIKKNTLPNLLSNFIKLENEIENEPLNFTEFISENNLHLAQMGYEFPLSFSQRKSLLTFLSKPSYVFAVNGPPGTGKTTLLQTIVANEIVNSAIKGLNPSIILACSSNNQAVTNIIDCFSKSNTKEGLLCGRWMPDIDGYATYLPASSKSETDLRIINYKKLNGEGIFSKIEKFDYHKKAKEYFIEKYKTYSNQNEDNVKSIIENLRKEILEIKEIINNLSDVWMDYKFKEKKYLKEFLLNNEDIKSFIENDLLNEIILNENLEKLKNLEVKILTYFSNESLMQRILCFLKIKSSIENRKAELRIIFRNSKFNFDKLIEYSKSEILNILNEKIQLAGATKGVLVKWKKLKNEYKLIGNPPDNENVYRSIESQNAKNGPFYFFDELDVSLRHTAFQLALHYWEGRWLIETENSFNLTENRGKDDTKRRWLRQAMITPCFVSTFYMSPKFFSYSMHLGKRDDGSSIWDNGPLYDFIDLLIVEEAGQVPPEIGTASFSLAKKAIVIGDTKQIEPIWKISNKIDIGNLYNLGLIKNYGDKIYEEIYDPKGFLCSTGSIMKMAQNSCMFKEPDSPEKGVMLLEHRRCYNEIIEYCNVLAYNGKLRPLKGQASKNNIIPPMICIHVEGNSTTFNKNRYNQNEVKEIIKWINFNKEKIENTYGKIEDSVGVVTPFVGQKKLLQNEFKSNGYDIYKMKIGTVHALQGAERHIVIFSMVYGKGEVGTMFFDRENKPNMLNVAVSRAKESFVVFANTEIFNKKAKSPSGILSNYLEFIH